MVRFSNIPSAIQSAKLNINISKDMPRLKASLHGKFARLARMLHVFRKTRYYDRVLAIARYEEARQEMMENMDTPDGETLPPVTLPQPYEETREDDLWSELLREHHKALDAETFCRYQGLSLGTKPSKTVNIQLSSP